MPEKASCAAALSLSISRPSGRSGSRFDAELDENRARVPRRKRIWLNRLLIAAEGSTNHGRPWRAGTMLWRREFTKLVIGRQTTLLRAWLPPIADSARRGRTLKRRAEAEAIYCLDHLRDGHRRRVECHDGLLGP